MIPTDLATVFVNLLPNLMPPGSLQGGVAVVVDVLRASTAIVYALAAGSDAVIPCQEIEEAEAIAARLPLGSALLAGERGSLPIPGFHLGNSPREFVSESCAGKTVVMTTTNGTRAILASRGADQVYVASFANLSATADQLADQFQKRGRGSIQMICSGTEGFISLEDSLLAGALTARLVATLGRTDPECHRLCNDEAIIALSAWREVERNLDQRPLRHLLSLGRGGQNLQRIGRVVDIEDAADLDRFKLIAMLRRNPLRVVAV
jgi:2-phosphosulfolactate phosphatase